MNFEKLANDVAIAILEKLALNTGEKWLQESMKATNPLSVVDKAINNAGNVAFQRDSSNAIISAPNKGGYGKGTEKGDLINKNRRSKRETESIDVDIETMKPESTWEPRDRLSAKKPGSVSAQQTAKNKEKIDNFMNFRPQKK